MGAPAEILEAVLLLPEDERAEIALRLVESLDVTFEENAEAAWADEIAARVEALRAGSAETVSLDRAIAEARAQLRSRRG